MDASMNDLTKPIPPDLDGLPKRDYPPSNSMNPIDSLKNNIL